MPVADALGKFTMSSNNFKNEKWFGVAKLFQEKPKGAPNWYWRVTCRKSKCPKELKSKNFSGEGAYEIALERVGVALDGLGLSEDHVRNAMVALSKGAHQGLIARLVEG